MIFAWPIMMRPMAHCFSRYWQIFIIGLLAVFLLGCNPIVQQFSDGGANAPQGLEEVDVVATCSPEYEPVCAAMEVQCVTTPCDPVRNTYNNACQADLAGAAVIHNGACPTEADLPEGSFAFNDYGNFYGDFYVSGFTKIKTVPETFCIENCAEYQIAEFNITQTGNQALTDFLEANKGNAYVEPLEGSTIGQVSLGCVETGKIVYSNDSDQYGMAQKSIEGAVAQKILNAVNPAQSISLKLTKLPLSGGRGVPACYSAFYDVDLMVPLQN